MIYKTHSANGVEEDGSMVRNDDYYFLISIKRVESNRKKNDTESSMCK